MTDSVKSYEKLAAYYIKKHKKKISADLIQDVIVTILTAESGRKYGTKKGYTDLCVQRFLTKRKKKFRYPRAPKYYFDKTLELIDAQECVDRIKSNLSAEENRLIDLIFYQDKTVEQIAQMDNKHISTIYKQYNNLLCKMRNMSTVMQLV